MRIAEVAYPLPLHRTFDYSVSPELASEVVPGVRVRAPFGPRATKEGLVLAVRDGTSKFKVKPVTRVLDPQPLLSAELIGLARWLAERYCAPIGECLKIMIPANLRDARRGISTDAAAADWAAVEVGKAPAATFTLTPDQNKALCRVSDKLKQHVFSSSLLFGVPASGKTEVYIRLIRQAVERGGQALFLVPEITLTRPFFEEFQASIGFPVALWHSQIGARRKRSVWLGLKSGVVRVVVGARSASLLPFKDLRLVVMDEEQDESYKQDGQVPYYHARDVALTRARAFQCAVVLGSATPSIEAFAQQQVSGLEILRLDSRTAKTEAPQISILERPPEHYGGCLTDELLERTRRCLERGEQSIMLVNRRGYSNFVMCRRCGWVARCSDCSVAYIHHKSGGGELFGDSYLLCHHCGKRSERPTACGKCGKSEFRYAGIGTQKVVEELKARLPAARVMRMDRDTVAKEKIEDEESIYADFLARKADILVGTKLVAKGFHFPSVTLVGVVDADTMLNMPDFRAAERTVQLLVQAAGRAGRAEKPGQVLLQTAQTTHYAIQAVARGDYGQFARQEMGLRKELFYPPYSTLVRVVFQGKKEDAVLKACAAAAKELRGKLDAKDEILGPAPGVHAMLQGSYRFHLLLKVMQVGRLAPALLTVRGLTLPSTVRIKVNVDPYDFF